MVLAIIPSMMHCQSSAGAGNNVASTSVQGFKEKSEARVNSVGAPAHTVPIVAINTTTATSQEWSLDPP